MNNEDKFYAYNKSFNYFAGIKECGISKSEVTEYVKLRNEYKGGQWIVMSYSEVVNEMKEAKQL